MANRAKRIALSSKKEKTAQLLRQLYKESELREVDRKLYRDQERLENREYIRLLRRGLPEWVVRNPVYVNLVAQVYEFKSSWLQTLKQFPWEEQVHLGDLEVILPAFLFAKYPVPPFMKSVFGEGDHLSMGWYVHLGQGKNIRTAMDLPFRMTKRMAHYFLESPDFGSVQKSLRFGQVLGYGGSKELALALIDSRMDYVPSRSVFWAEVIQWMINYPNIHPDYVQIIVSYIHERKFRRMRLEAESEEEQIHSVAIDPGFSIKGRTYENLLTSAIEWNWLKAQLGDHGQNTIVKGIGDLHYFTGGGNKPRMKYEIRPLLTAAEIIEEGRVMRHCVGSYASDVGIDNTSIWSLTETRVDSGKSRRLLTIEVLRDKIIEEVRGVSNRLATSFERTLVKRWASQEGLTWEENEYIY